MKKSSKKPKTPKIPHCLQLDLPNINYEKASAAVEYLKDLFSSYGALGCMRSKCTTCINYCKYGVFLKSHGFSSFGGFNFATYLIYFKTGKGLTRALAECKNMKTPFGPLERLESIQYEYSDTEQSESETEDEETDSEPEVSQKDCITFHKDVAVFLPLNYKKIGDDQDDLNQLSKVTDEFKSFGPIENDEPQLLFPKDPNTVDENGKTYIVMKFNYLDWKDARSASKCRIRAWNDNILKVDYAADVSCMHFYLICH